MKERGAHLDVPPLHDLDVAHRVSVLEFSSDDVGEDLDAHKRGKEKSVLGGTERREID